MSGLNTDKFIVIEAGCDGENDIIGVFDTENEAKRVATNCQSHLPWSSVNYFKVVDGLNPKYSECANTLRITVPQHIPDRSKICVDLEYTNKSLKNYSSYQLDKIGEKFNGIGEKFGEMFYPVKVRGESPCEYFKKTYPQFAKEYNNIACHSPFSTQLGFAISP